MAVQQQTKQKRELESRFMDFVAKKRRITTLPETKSVVHAASTRVANPFSFDTKMASSSMNSVRDRNPDLFNALSGFSSGNLRDRMGQIAKINGN